jgi:hypothetical protein
MLKQPKMVQFVPGSGEMSVCSQPKGNGALAKR